MDRISANFRTLVAWLSGRLARILLLILGIFTLLIVACGLTPASSSTVGITESSLAGIWEGNYSLHNGVDFLVVKSDGTYQQFYEDKTGYLYIGEMASWYLKDAGAGRFFVIFEAGRYFPAGVDFSKLLGVDPSNPNRLYPFYDPVDSGSRQMSNELILEIFPARTDKGIMLCQFPLDIDSKQECIYPVEFD